jgi:hypothetical protein
VEELGSRKASGGAEFGTGFDNAFAARGAKTCGSMNEEQRANATRPFKSLNRFSVGKRVVGDMGSLTPIQFFRLSRDKDCKS